LTGTATVAPSAGSSISRVSWTPLVMIATVARPAKRGVILALISSP
jgi:hypothetical protein